MGLQHGYKRLSHKVLPAAQPTPQRLAVIPCAARQHGTWGASGIPHVRAAERRDIEAASSFWQAGLLRAAVQ